MNPNLFVRVTSEEPKKTHKRNSNKPVTVCSTRKPSVSATADKATNTIPFQEKSAEKTTSKKIAYIATKADD